MRWLFISFAAAAGILSALQAGSNATLKKGLGQPLWATVFVFVIGLICLLAMALASGERFPLRTAIASPPWWAWVGGVFGAIFILSMVVVADKLGAAVFTGVTVTASLIASLVMDHYGLLGFDVHRAGIARIAGAALMLSGLGLIAKY